MIINGMFVLWIIINLADLQYPFIISFTKVKRDLKNNTQFTFIYRMVIMKPVTISKFFYIICNTVFILLIATSQLEGGLLGPIFNYFTTIEINNHSILHLHCFV